MNEEKRSDISAATAEFRDICNYWSVENMGYVSAKIDEQKTDATLSKIQALVQKL